MVEISEKERSRRKANKGDADNKVPAQSFRFGKEARDKLLKISRRRDKSQADVMRDLIDQEYERLFS